jgi:hypothetical protein
MEHMVLAYPNGIFDQFVPELKYLDDASLKRQGNDDTAVIF